MERTSRHLGIEGWKQEALDRATLGIVGEDLAVEILALSAAALGIGKLRLVRADLRKRRADLVDVARAIQPGVRLGILDSVFVSKGQTYLLNGVNVVADLCGYAVGKKLVIQLLFESGVPGVLLCPADHGISIYTYYRGRENANLEAVLPESPLPVLRGVDPVLALIGGGLVLEEVKNLLMGRDVSDRVVNYQARCSPGQEVDASDARVLVVGAGALGNIVGLGLDLIGAGQVDIIDHDHVEITNLNRQVLFYGAVGRPKATTLASRLRVKARGIVGRFDSTTPLEGYDVVFDCVDKYESRILLSERCQREGRTLISGGTNYRAGQVVSFVPGYGSPPHEALEMNKSLKEQQRREADASECILQPEPSVIISNEIIGGIMVDEFRRMIASSSTAKGSGQEIICYDAEEPNRIGAIPVNR